MAFDIDHFYKPEVTLTKYELQYNANTHAPNLGPAWAPLGLSGHTLETLTEYRRRHKEPESLRIIKVTTTSEVVG